MPNKVAMLIRSSTHSVVVDLHDFFVGTPGLICVCYTPSVASLCCVQERWFES